MSGLATLVLSPQTRIDRPAPANTSLRMAKRARQRREIPTWQGEQLRMGCKVWQRISHLVGHDKRSVSLTQASATTALSYPKLRLLTSHQCPHHARAHQSSLLRLRQTQQSH